MTQGQENTGPQPTGPGSEREGLDLARIRRLVDELQATVADAPADAPGVQDLKDEIVTLRAVLDSPKEKSGWITEGLHDIRAQLQKTGKSVRGEALREGVFIAEIGRILGL